MNHIDEGTIHAWLDGALSVEEARAVESHVAQCAECSAAVAEARGLVAASSRILTALDDVPANVTPKRAPVAKRQWRAAPWVTGIAATLMLAIGIATVNRGGRLERSQASDATLALERSPLVAQPGADSVSVAAPPVAVARPSMKVTVPQPKRATTLLKSSAASLTDAATGGTAAARLEGRSPSVAPGAVASADKSAANIATDTAKRRRLGDGRVQLDEVVVTAMPESRLTARNQALAIDPLAGCYRLAVATYQSTLGQRAQRAGVGAAAAPAPPSPSSSRSSREVRSAAPASERADVTAVTTPSLIRLDTVRTALGFVVRAAQSDSIIGSWDEVPGDSVRVALENRGTFVLSRAGRVSCPEP